MSGNGDRNVSDLYGAMIGVMVEDAAGKPCVICRRPGEYVNLWVPPQACLRRDFGFSDDLPRTAVYSLCRRCGRKARRSKWFMARIESAVVKIIKDEKLEGQL
jgi:hypothetical protein